MPAPASRTTIVEFEIFPHRPPAILGGQSVLRWEGKWSVDLRWVAAAEEYDAHHRTTQIYLCGSGLGGGREINIAYVDFMTLWLEARNA